MRLKTPQLIIFLILLIVYGCNDKTPYEPELEVEPDPDPIEYPEGFQFDIEWPSLAESPWPINRGNPQGNCRSKYPGPQAGIVDWQLGEVVLSSGIAIGADENIFLASENPHGSFCKVGEEGSLKWRFAENGIHFDDLILTPTVLADSSILFGDGHDLFNLNPDGELKWRASKSFINSSILVTKDSHILLFTYANTLLELNLQGELIKSSSQNSVGITPFSMVVLSPDSKTVYACGRVVSLVAINLENHSEIWTFGDIKTKFYPMVDSWGNIYTSTLNTEYSEKYALYSIKPDGSARWYYEHNDRMLSDLEFGGAIDKNGNVIFGNRTLISLNYKGELNWEVELDGEIAGSPLVDVNGNIYVSCFGGNSAQLLYAYSSEGVLMWSMSDEFSTHPGRGSALVNGGLILSSYKSGDSRIYSIK